MDEKHEEVVERGRGTHLIAGALGRLQHEKITCAVVVADPFDAREAHCEPSKPQLPSPVDAPSLVQ